MEIQICVCVCDLVKEQGNSVPSSEHLLLCGDIK